MAPKDLKMAPGVHNMIPRGPKMASKGAKNGPSMAPTGLPRMQVGLQNVIILENSKFGKIDMSE